MAKSTDSFKRTIQEHLNYRAFSDKLFAKTLLKENKNIDDCINYVLQQVQKSGKEGWTDDEVYNLAIHYYDEDDLAKAPQISGRVIVNHQVRLTPQEIEEQKQKAKEVVFNEQRNKMLKKPVKKSISESTKKEETKEPGTLF